MKSKISLSAILAVCGFLVLFLIFWMMHFSKYATQTLYQAQTYYEEANKLLMSSNVRPI